MKILFHHRIRSRDGQSVHLDELAQAFRAEGHEVLVVGPDSFARASFGHEPKLLGRMKRLMPKALYELLELGYNVPAYFRLRRAWRAFRPDVIYERYNLSLLAGVWLKRRTGIPLLLEVNAPLVRERTTHDGLALQSLARKLEAWIWRSANYVLPVTEVLANEVRGSGVPASRIATIPNAIDPKRFGAPPSVDAAKSALGLSGKTVLGFTGFVRDWHGLDAILDWLGQPETPRTIHLLLAGEGPALPGLKAQAKRLGIEDRVTFAGLVDRDSIARLIAAFDIALQPKCVAYASPLKLFEYMALGKAIAAPDQANIREVLAGNKSALLFDPENPQSMIAALGKLADDSELRERLGAEARRAIALKRYTWRENARRVAALVQPVKALSQSPAVRVELRGDALAAIDP